MSDVRIRCSSLGKIMPEPKTKAEGILSVGARTYIRTLAAEDIFGVTFEFSSKETEKGLEVEDESIAMLNRVRGLSLAKNTERKTNDLITGEADLFDAQRRRGHDIKSSWSLKTFPISVADCEDRLYEFQMRGYMMLWDADEWSIDYCMVETPERLIGYDPLQLHLVSHIPEHMRITSWTVRRDATIEERIIEKVKAAREYYHQAVDEFDRTHRAGNPLEAAAIIAPTERPIVVPSAALSSPLAALLSA
jgi:hypothetical protein